MDNTIRVLIADDDTGMRMILRKLLQKEDGFEVCGEAGTGEETLSVFAREHPDVCFLDVEMPGMTGLECARAIQDTAPRTILIFATAHDDYMAEAFEVYAFDYMVKPFKLERVRQTLDRIRQVRQVVSEVRVDQRRLKKKKQSDGRLMLRHREGVSFVRQQEILLIRYASADFTELLTVSISACTANRSIRGCVSGRYPIIPHLKLSVLLCFFA